MSPQRPLLRDQARVQCPIGQVNHSVRQPLLPAAIVVLPRPASQRLNDRPKGSAANWVEDSADQDRPVFAGADPELAVLHQIRLLNFKALAVSRVPVVVAEVIELAR